MISTTRFCTRCGVALEANVRFCENCGKPVFAPESQQPTDTKQNKNLSIPSTPTNSSSIIIQLSNPPKDSVTATPLSLFLFGGVGQIYLGQIKKGIVLTLGSLFLLSFNNNIKLLGSFLIFISTYDAYAIAKRLKCGQAVGE